MAENQLMKYFGFDETDLAANQRGELSQKQRSKLEGEVRSSKLWFAVLGGALLLAAIGLAAKIFQGVAAAAPLELGQIIPTLAAGVLSFFFLRKTFETVYDYKAKKVEGMVKIQADKASTRDGEIPYELRVEDKIFNVSGEIKGLMPKGNRYAIYYIEDLHSSANNSILSVEWITQKKQKEQ